MKIYNALVETGESRQTFQRKEGVSQIKPRCPNGPILHPIPICPPSQLPPLGDLHLQVDLDQYITHGRSGIFYTVKTSLPDGQKLSLSHPPLVAKIALPNFNKALWHEMSMYTEMESIQGIAVPRCYGLFEGIVRDSMASILPREESHGGNKQSQNDDDEDLGDQQEPLLPPRTQHRPTSITGRVTILLLEQLGAHLPVGEIIPPDVRYVYCTHP